MRQVLDDQGIVFYETSAGNWGLGSAALWVRDEDDYARARNAIDNFQQQWQRQARETGTAAGIRWHRVPALLFVLGAILWVLYKSFIW